jgi:putative addiction module component (TIGR02574 family)
MSSAAPKPAPTAEELLEQALQLPKAQRLKLAEQICQSVQDSWPTDVHPAWQAEIVRRIRSLMDGSATFVEGDEHIRRLRDKYSV